MRPIPVAFHIWFLELHTYGIGLALTFWFGLRYTERRLRKAGYPWQWVTGMFVWVIVAAIVGARAFHVLSNLSYYSHQPSQVFAIWQGGLSSFGGLIFAVPVAIVSARRRCPQLPTMRFADLMAPVLMACWGLGRLLGPQLMVAGGGHPTNQWFGMYYAGQVGKRLPVPIFQSIEDFTIFGILLLVERWLRLNAPTPVTVSSLSATDTAAEVDADVDGAGTRAIGYSGDEATPSAVNGEATSPVEVEASTGEVGSAAPAPRLLPPAGIVLGVGMVLWGIERFFDEHLWLGEDGHLGSLLVQGAGIILAVSGVILLATKIRPLQAWRRGEGGDPAPELLMTDATDPTSAVADSAEDGDDADRREDPDHDPALPKVTTATGPILNQD
jgi:hypothetical protein